MTRRRRDPQLIADEMEDALALLTEKGYISEVGAIRSFLRWQADYIHQQARTNKEIMKDIAHRAGLVLSERESAHFAKEPPKLVK